MKLSIVTTLYKSANYLHEFYRRVITSAELITQDLELIFVNDGSPDNSLDIVLELQKKDKRIVIIDLSRNFGHHKAIMTGLSHAVGEKIFLIDCDLEEDPELIGKFWESMQKEKCDVVYGYQEKRKGNWFERISGYLQYKIVNYLSDVYLHANLVTLRIMSKRYVQQLIKHQENAVNIASLWYMTGYKQIPLAIVKHANYKTTYTLRRKLSVLVNTITAFSARPLIYIFYSGLSILLFSLCYVTYLIFAKLFLHTPISGWASLIVSIWILGGLTIFFIGIIGIYLSKIFIEVKHRPYTIIRDIYKEETNEL